VLNIFPSPHTVGKVGAKHLDSLTPQEAEYHDGRLDGGSNAQLGLRGVHFATP